MSSALETLQSAVAERLRQQLNLAGATVLVRRASDLDSQIEAAAEGALGLCVIVLDPRPKRVAPAVPGPAFLEIVLTVRIIENLLTETEGPGLLAAAERSSQVLHLWPLPPDCGDGALQIMETDPWTIPPGTLRGANALDLHFHASCALALAATN